MSICLYTEVYTHDILFRIKLEPTVLLFQRRCETVDDASQNLQQLPDAVVSWTLVHKPDLKKHWVSAHAYGLYVCRHI